MQVEIVPMTLSPGSSIKKYVSFVMTWHRQTETSRIDDARTKSYTDRLLYLTSIRFPIAPSQSIHPERIDFFAFIFSIMVCTMYHRASWPAKLIQTLDATTAAVSALSELPDCDSPDATAGM